ncbi:hypothetical protein EDD18DRAFT_1351897 [Armillaria luteobubalina]|uniref:Heterokaryon incompatibility domain-containing protein n=1 Tax=Armillaria luteobubalina TaxID=153913 RepID=A0AA39UPP5_9AGAR|nr:hypothetical protein EDD18DRAFT_1351897 [Armillaria luteobubalina]
MGQLRGSGYNLRSSPCIDGSDALSHSRNEERLGETSEVWISALKETGIEELSIKVPLQRAYHGRKPVISSSLADTSCSKLGVHGLLHELNTTLGTSYTQNIPSLSYLLSNCITQNYDFGTVYAQFCPFWHDLTAIEDSLYTGKKKDKDMRQRALVGNSIMDIKIPPRHVWDLYSNRVVPCWVIKNKQWPKPISHAWVDETDQNNVWTPINRYEWPVPIPKGANLDLIRIEMLNLGVEYTWLDVLCLRQKGGKREDLCAEEWQLDVATIGYLYHVAEVVVWYLSGLGRPLSLKEGDLDSDRSWFRWAWTLQEIGEDQIIAGDTEDGPLHAKPIDGEGHYADKVLTRFYKQLHALDNISPDSYDIFGILAQMRDRVSANPLDKITGLASCLESAKIPAYYENQSLEDAWTALVNTIIPWL